MLTSKCLIIGLLDSKSVMTYFFEGRQMSPRAIQRPCFLTFSSFTGIFAEWQLRWNRIYPKTALLVLGIWMTLPTWTKLPRNFVSTPKGPPMKQKEKKLCGPSPLVMATINGSVLCSLRYLQMEYNAQNPFWYLRANPWQRSEKIWPTCCRKISRERLVRWRNDDLLGKSFVEFTEYLLRCK